MTTLMKRNAGNGNAPATTFGSLVDKFFQNDLGRLLDDDRWGFTNLSRNVHVPVNVRETDNSYELELVAPGLKREDFNVNVSGDMLTVSFEQKEETKQQDKEDGWLRREYRQQSFSRSFSLDDTVDANKITAKYSDGVLHLSMPKKEGSQRMTRTIEIK